jgi:hypothetical protein
VFARARLLVVVQFSPAVPLRTHHQIHLDLRSHQQFAESVDDEMFLHHASHERQVALQRLKRRSRHRRHLVQDRDSPLLV